MNPQLERFLTLMMSNNAGADLDKLDAAKAAPSVIPTSGGQINGTGPMSGVPNNPALSGMFKSQPQAQMQTGVADASQDAGMANAFDPEAAVYAQGLPPSPSNINSVMDSMPRGKEVKDVESPVENRAEGGVEEGPISQKSNATPFAAGLDALMAKQGMNVAKKVSPLPMNIPRPQTNQATLEGTQDAMKAYGGGSKPMPRAPDMIAPMKKTLGQQAMQQPAAAQMQGDMVMEFINSLMYPKTQTPEQRRMQ